MSNVLDYPVSSRVMAALASSYAAQPRVWPPSYSPNGRGIGIVQNV
ncbi:hypothetical protein [Nocardioides speluncae]|nr:hypothetical protein [Nocardioides speluncae]